MMDRVDKFCNCFQMITKSTYLTADQQQAPET